MNDCIKACCIYVVVNIRIIFVRQRKQMNDFITIIMIMFKTNEHSKCVTEKRHVYDVNQLNKLEQL